MSPACAESLGI